MSQEYDKILAKALANDLENMVKENQRLNATKEGREQLARKRVDRKAAEKKITETRKQNEKRLKKIEKAAAKSTLWRLKRIVSRGASDKELAFAMVEAIHNGRLKNIQFLHKSGADLNTISAIGTSFLMTAISKGYMDIARYLVDNGADVNLINKYGDSALSNIFSSSSSAESARFLISAGAKLDIWDKYGISPLINALQQGQWETAEVLVRGGADVNFADKDGKTPLMYAVAFNKLNVVKWLVECRSRINQKDNEGRTAAMYVTNYKFPSWPEQKAYAKKQGVDIDNFDTYKEAQAALESAKVLCEFRPEKLSIAIHVPDKACEILWYLREKGLDINIQNNKGETIPQVLLYKNYYTHYFFYYGFLEGFDYTLKDCNGNSYLFQYVDGVKAPLVECWKFKR